MVSGPAAPGGSGAGRGVSGRLWLVSGRVQGVGFRWSVLQEARALGLVGYAENRADGRVEVAAAGDETALEELHAYLQDGPAHARVDAVEAGSYPHEVDNYNSFIVK